MKKVFSVDNLVENNEKNNILVVDDEVANLEILNTILGADYSVHMTKKGSSVINFAEKYLPDLILLDIIMPEINGYEILRQLKSGEKTRHIPVIIITGLDTEEDEAKGLALDAADFITKPFSSKIVKLRVQHQLQIVNRIRDIKRYSHELVKVQAALAATEEKSKFFAKISHEMRTPLNAVIGLSEMLLDEGDMNEDAVKSLEQISNAGTSLLHTVNDILDLSKINAGKFKIVPGEYDIPGMINATVTQAIIHKGDKPVNFLLTIDKNIPLHLFGDNFRITQIFVNLLSNAFKYTTEGTVELNIKCERTGDIVWLLAFVKDTGMGITSEHLNNMFTDYSQGEVKTKIKIEGTGLGLSITKMLLDMMDGSISVESELDKGSIFSVKIPQKFVSNEVISQDILDQLNTSNYKIKRKKFNRIILPYARVLVVDDVLSNLDVARGMMKPYRMHIDCVTSGQQAVDAIRDEKVKYNAVFMDQMMPVMDGVEAVRIIREEIGTEYAKKIPIIALTANALPGNKEYLLGKYFQDFVSKPIEILHLDEVLRTWVRDEELEKSMDSFLSLRTGQDRRSGKDRRHGYDRRMYKDKIEGMDLQKGVQRFSGNWDTFLQVLKSFPANTRLLLESMKDVNKENLPLYAINVHGIKSSCRGICAEDCAGKAEALETAAKAGDLDFVKTNSPLLLETALKLTENIDVFLVKYKIVDPEQEKPKKKKPYKEALSNLLDACENFKTEEIDTILKEIECFEYTDDDGLVSWLRENTEQMNYTEIAERLSSLA